VLFIDDTKPRASYSERAGPGSLVLLIGDTLPCASRSERAGLGSLVLLIGDTLPCASRSERARPGSLVLLIYDTPCASRFERAVSGSLVLLARRAGQSSAAYWQYAAPRLSFRAPPGWAAECRLLAIHCPAPLIPSALGRAA